MKIQKISKSYPNAPLLKEISLSLKEGESVAIMGRSGEGKTTLLHIIGTLETPDSGEIEINGKKITNSNAVKVRNQEIGFIFQSYNLLEDFSALENVLMPAKIGRRKVSKEDGLSLLKLVGLQEKADILAKVLSGGERQRVAIARALCNNPSLILADEPTGNLDRVNAQMIMKLLLSLKKKLIIVTHDPELANLCDRKLILKEGKLTLP